MSDFPAKIDNHVEQALARMISAMKEKPRFEDLLGTLVVPVQELEDVMFQLLQERSLTDDFNPPGSEAVGVQLDNLGIILGLNRYTDQTDESYRLDLKSWVRYLLSQGEAEVMIFVLKALTDSDDVCLQEYFPGHVILLFNGIVLNGENLSSIMDKCAGAGIRVDITHYSETPFRFDSGPGYDQGEYGLTLSQQESE